MFIMKNKLNVLSNSYGFTVMEAILVMFILSIIMMIFPLLFQTIIAITQSLQVAEDYEWNLFLIDLRHELQNVDEVVVFQERIHLLRENMLVTYERYGETIRRRVNNSGHEVVLQQVKQLHFYKDQQLLTLEIEFVTGMKDEALFLLPGEASLDAD